MKLIIMSSTDWPALAVLLLAFAALHRANRMEVEETKESEATRLIEKFMKMIKLEREGYKALIDGDSLTEQLYGYKILNEQLESGLPNSQSVDDNLAYAATLAKTERSGAVELFTMLNQLKKDGKGRSCDSLSEATLRINLYLTGGLPKGSRLATIVNKIVQTHVEECAGVYVTRYSELLGKMSKQERDNLFSVLPNNLTISFVSNNPAAFVSLMHGYDSDRIGIDSSWKTKLARLLSDTLKRGSSGVSKLDFLANGLAAVDRGKFVWAYSELLKKPCKSFVQMFGPEVFKPARLGLGVSAAPRRPLSPEEVEFAFGLFRFEICTMLLNDYQDGFMEDVMRAINN